MQKISALLTITARLSGAALIAAAAFAVSGRLFPVGTPTDDVAAVSLLALTEGVLYLLPLRAVLAGRNRVLLYLAATLFVPFLVALTAVNYGVQSTASSEQVAGNLISAGVVFLVSMCPPAAVVVSLLQRQRTK